MRQSEVRAENAHHARDLFVNDLERSWMHYLRDEENLSFIRRKIVNFIAQIYIFPFIDCLLLLFNVFYHRSDREIPTAAAFAAVLNMSSSGHVDK